MSPKFICPQMTRKVKYGIAHCVPNGSAVTVMSLESKTIEKLKSCSVLDFNVCVR